MQALLAVMMAGVNAILGTANVNQTTLIGAFGIYYKIQQIALFSAFGLSNTIITILSFNYGMRDKKRIDDCIKYGIIDTLVTTLIITILFEVFAKPLSSLFALGSGTSQIINVRTTSLRIASIGFIFMGFSISVQNIMKNYNDSYEDAIKQIKKSDSSRSNYYSVITNKVWGDKSNYDLCIDSQIGNESAAKIIYEFVKKKQI